MTHATPLVLSTFYNFKTFSSKLVGSNGWVGCSSSADCLPITNFQCSSGTCSCRLPYVWNSSTKTCDCVMPYYVSALTCGTIKFDNLVVLRQKKSIMIFYWINFFLKSLLVKVITCNHYTYISVIPKLRVVLYKKI